ncbi:MAG: hypothetical protein JO104_00595 [Candidatus Eremiobacteraeota bacterium]|nr:hypothetical protein [Candidatus Eremiobacteraeota bacterium]
MMSEGYRTTPPDQPWSSSASPGNGYQGTFGEKSPQPDEDAGDAGKVVLVGVLGGLLSAAGYMIYRRLPDEQKHRLHAQVRSIVQQRISEIRQNFNI